MNKFKLMAGHAKRAAVGVAVSAAFLVSQAHAALDQTAFDAVMTATKTDIGIVGGGFLLLVIAIAVWRYLKRAAN